MTDFGTASTTTRLPPPSFTPHHSKCSLRGPWLAAFCCCTVTADGTVEVISGAVVLAFSLAFGALEALQMYSTLGAGRYASEVWNYLDMLTVAFAAGVGINSLGLLRVPDVWRMISAVLMWLRVVFFLRGFDSTATLVRIVLEIIKDSTPFFVLIILLILAMSHGTLMVARSSDDDFDIGHLEFRHLLTAPWSPLFMYRVVVGGEAFAEDANVLRLKEGSNSEVSIGCSSNYLIRAR